MERGDVTMEQDALTMAREIDSEPWKLALVNPKGIDGEKPKTHKPILKLKVEKFLDASIRFVFKHSIFSYYLILGLITAFAMLNTTISESMVPDPASPLYATAMTIIETNAQTQQSLIMLNIGLGILGIPMWTLYSLHVREKL